jgi:protein-tyrosine-phosphatase
MPSVLFVCTANQFRSPIAALCFSKVVRNEEDDANWTIESAGTWTSTGLQAPPVAMRVAGMLGLEGLEGHLTRQIDHDLIGQYHLIIVMENNHKEAILNEFPAVSDRLYTLSELATGIPYDIPDPAYPDIDPEDVGRELKNLINRGKKKILELARSKSEG